MERDRPRSSEKSERLQAARQSGRSGPIALEGRVQPPILFKNRFLASRSIFLISQTQRGILPTTDPPRMVSTGQTTQSLKSSHWAQKQSDVKNRSIRKRGWFSG